MMIFLIVVFAILIGCMGAAIGIALYLIYSAPKEHRARLKSAFWQGFFGTWYRPLKKNS